MQHSRSVCSTSLRSSTTGAELQPCQHTKAIPSSSCLSCRHIEQLNWRSLFRGLVLATMCGHLAILSRSLLQQVKFVLQVCSLISMKFDQKSIILHLVSSHAGLTSQLLLKITVWGLQDFKTSRSLAQAMLFKAHWCSGEVYRWHYYKTHDFPLRWQHLRCL